MENDSTSFIKISGTEVRITANTLAEAKIALKELKLKKKEYNLNKRVITEEQKAIRANYTSEVRGRGSMVRGGGGIGRFFRAFQTISRDSKRSHLANMLSPLEAEKQKIEKIIRLIDAGIIQVEAHLLKNG